MIFLFILHNLLFNKQEENFISILIFIQFCVIISKYENFSKKEFFMNGITLFMAFVDAVPAVIFLCAALVLMKDFSEDISEKGFGSYALVSSGALMLFSGAILKVAWKVMYALNICDYTTFSESFFPMQTLGFCLVSLGIIAYICKNRKTAIILQSVYGTLMFVIMTFLIVSFSSSAKEGIETGTEVFVYESHMPFLLGTFIGFMTMQIALIVIAVKRQAKRYIIAFVFSMIFMIAEAVVGSMFDGSSNMHWVAQFIHIFAEIGLLIGVKGIYKNKTT